MAPNWAGNITQAGLRLSPVARSSCTSAVQANCRWLRDGRQAGYIKPCQLICKPRHSCSARKAAAGVEGALAGADEHPEVISQELSEAVTKEEQPQISMSTLLKFTLPTLAIWLIGPSLSLVDTAVVGTKSATQLAALGPGCILCDLNGYFFTFLAVATTNLMAISIANRNKHQATEILSDAIGIALLLGVLFGGATYLACPAILQAMTGSASTQVVGPASTYVRIRCFGAPAAFVMFVTNAFFLAAWDPMTPLKSAVLAGVTNLVLDLFLVNVMHWGIAGAAVATAAAQTIVACLLVAAVYRPLPSWSPISGWEVKIKWRLPSPKAISRFLIFAGPICFVLLTKVIMYNCLGSYSSSMGPIQSASSHLVMAVFGFFAVFGDVISQAAQTFLPGWIGKPKAAQQLGKKLITAGASIGAVNSLIAAGIVLLVPWIFTSSPDVIALAARLSPLLAGALCIHTASLATEGMLMAGRDLSFLVRSYVINMGLTLGSLFAVRYYELGVIGSFLCLCQFQLTRLLVNSLRLLRSENSPMKRTEALQSWMTKEAQAAASG